MPMYIAFFFLSRDIFTSPIGVSVAKLQAFESVESITIILLYAWIIDSPYTTFDRVADSTRRLLWEIAMKKASSPLV